MRATILIALLAFSFVTVCASPNQTHDSVHKTSAHYQLKRLELPLLIVAPTHSIGFLIDLIGLIVGSDLNLVIKQASFTLIEIEVALNSAAEQLAEGTFRVDEESALEVVAFLNAAVAEALEIIQPLLDVLAPVISDSGNKSAKVALADKLLDKLLLQFLGVTFEELFALIKKTDADLEALAVRTIAQIDEIASRQELQAEVNRITTETKARIADAHAPLHELIVQIALHPESHRVVPKMGLAGFIGLVVRATSAINVSRARADAALVALIPESQILEDINELLQVADENMLATNSAALDKALDTPIEEQPALIESTVGTTYLIAIEALSNIIFLINSQAPEILTQIEEITTELENDIGAALLPLIDLSAFPESHAVAPKINLPELIALVSQASIYINAALARARAAHVALLECSEILEDLNKILLVAEENILAASTAVLKQAVKTPIEKLPSLVESTVGTAYLITLKAQNKVVLLIKNRAPEISPKIGEINRQLKNDIQTALKPLKELITPPEGGPIDNTVPKLVEFISAEVRKMTTSASVALENLLAETDVIEEVLDLVVAAEAEALRLIEEGVTKFFKTKAEKLEALLTGLTGSLKTLLNKTTDEIAVIVFDEDLDLIHGLYKIIAQLNADIRALSKSISNAIKSQA